jgi:hypothetical protein
MDAVQSYANVISGVLGTALIGYLCYRWRKEGKFIGVALFSAALILALIALSDAALLVNNVERIHFVQYAGVAFLLRLSLEDNALVFFATVYSGVVDEFIQYLMNPVRTSYLDFNDMVFNSLGAALGVVFAIVILSPGRAQSSRYEMQFRRAFFALTSLTFALVLSPSLQGVSSQLKAELQNARFSQRSRGACRLSCRLNRRSNSGKQSTTERHSTFLGLGKGCWCLPRSFPRSGGLPPGWRESDCEYVRVQLRNRFKS